MRRILLAVTGTVLGLVALLSFKTHSPTSNSQALPSAGLAPTTSSSSATPTPTGTSAPPKPGSSKTSTAPTPTASPISRTITGQSVDTQYGTVQVQIVVSGTKITNVSFVKLTAYDQRSQDINTQAGPILLQETLSAQSAQIDTVSGATYTSEGYLQSLQSALDAAGIK